MRRLVIIAVVIAAAMIACGLDVTGVPAPGTSPPGAPGSIPPGAPPTPGTAPPPPGTPPGTPPPPSSSCTCALVPEAGFTLVAYASDRSASCPGDMTGTDVVADPAGGAGACACGTCLMSGVPSCTGGTFSTMFDQGATATCGTTSGVTHAGNNGACAQYDNFLAKHSRAIAPSPSGTGTCSAPGVGQPDAVKATAGRSCAQTGATCACDPAMPPAFKTCMRAAGDVACPASAPTKHVVGSGVEVACPACGCTLSATCSGTINFYSDTTCKSLVAAVTTATCSDTNSADYASLAWLGTTNATCNLTPAPLGTPSLTAAATICCP